MIPERVEAQNGIIVQSCRGLSEEAAKKKRAHENVTCRDIPTAVFLKEQDCGGTVFKAHRIPAGGFYIHVDIDSLLL